MQWFFRWDFLNPNCFDTSCLSTTHGLSWGHWQVGNNRERTLSIFFSTCMLCSLFFCGIWGLCVPWVTSNLLYIYIILYIICYIYIKKPTLSLSNVNAIKHQNHMYFHKDTSRNCILHHCMYLCERYILKI